MYIRPEMHQWPSMNDRSFYFTVVHIGLLINVYWTKKASEWIVGILKPTPSEPKLDTPAGELYPCSRGPWKEKPWMPEFTTPYPPWGLEETSYGPPPWSAVGPAAEVFLHRILHESSKSKIFGTFEEVVKTESEVAQSCLTLWHSMACSLPGFSVHGVFQVRVLEWVAISFFGGSSPPRDQTQISLTAGRRFTLWATREAPEEVRSTECQHSEWEQEKQGGTGGLWGGTIWFIHLNGRVII